MIYMSFSFQANTTLWSCLPIPDVTLRKEMSHDSALQSDYNVTEAVASSRFTATEEAWSS